MLMILNELGMNRTNKKTEVRCNKSYAENHLGIGTTKKKSSPHPMTENPSYKGHTKIYTNLRPTVTTVKNLSLYHKGGELTSILPNSFSSLDMVEQVLHDSDLISSI